MKARRDPNAIFIVGDSFAADSPRMRALQAQTIVEAHVGHRRRVPLRDWIWLAIIVAILVLEHFGVTP